ncbi:MAG: cytochrome c oxidase assembly protein [Xanthobacteraceae bacterium]
MGAAKPFSIALPLVLAGCGAAMAAPAGPEAPAIWTLCLATLPAVRPGAVWSAWSLAPEIVLPLAAFVGLYGTGWLRARASARDGSIGTGHGLATGLGGLLLALALVSPLCRLSATLASAHMVQHLILVGLAPPLIVLGAPGPALRLTLSRVISWPPRKACPSGADHASDRGLFFLIGAAFTYGVAIWAWHSPALYQAALTSESMHLIFVVSLIAVSLWFWRAVLGAACRGIAAPTIVLLVTMIHTGLLGALLTFSPAPWYPLMAAGALTWGLLPLEDQQLAGVIMWAPMGAIYLVAALILIGMRLGEPSSQAAAAGKV